MQAQLKLGMVSCKNTGNWMPAGCQCMSARRPVTTLGVFTPLQSRVSTLACVLACPQVYCGWGNSQCVLRNGTKRELPADSPAATPGGTGSIQ